MSNILVSPETPQVLTGFDPAEDMLIFALPEDPEGGLDHRLAIRRHPARDLTEVALTHIASGARFVVRLPGVRQLDPASVAVLPLAAVERLTLPRDPADNATLTGPGRYPADQVRTGKGPRKMALLHRHNWYRDGPPAERFFDLSDPGSELDIRLDTENGGPVYAIRLTERSGQAPTPREVSHSGDTLSSGLAAEVHRSIVLVQTSPGTPLLSSALLAQWFTSHLGGPDFRVIAWVWLGNEGQYPDPATGRTRRFGHINRNPLLAIHGPLAASIAIDR